MIDRFQLLRNIGQFDNVSPPQQITFTPFSLIYGENGRGKTTIAAILRSLAISDPALIQERQRLGSQRPPHVVICHTAGQSIFQNGAWTQPLTNIAIFDDAFVSANVCSGIEVQSAHRQGLHELILGAQGVALNKTLKGYLRRFAASFRLGEVQSVNTRSGSSASYSVVINQQNVNVSADTGPSFRNTLSAGDRNTLALAFFFTSLEQDPDLANKIVVIDDPMTSLDEHRTLRTREEVFAISQRVQQVIVLSHSKPFLCRLWEQADRNGSTAFRVNRAAVGSELAVWDVRNDSVSEHDKRHELARGYLAAADPAREREVAAALRHILEAFMRVACPEHFAPGQLLGPFIGQCEQRLGTNNQILSANDITELRALLAYANQFHHDTNPAWQTAAINDAELTDFTERVLVFASRG